MFFIVPAACLIYLSILLLFKAIRTSELQAVLQIVTQIKERANNNRNPLKK